MRPLLAARPIAPDPGPVARNARAMNAEIEEQSQHDPEPGRSRYSAGAKRIDHDVRQGGQRHEEDAKERQNPAIMEALFYQRRLKPDDQYQRRCRLTPS